MNNPESTEKKKKRKRRHRSGRSNNARKARRRNYFESDENKKILEAVDQVVWPTRKEAAHVGITLYENRLKNERLYVQRRRGGKKEITSRFEFELGRWTGEGANRPPLAYFYLGGLNLGSRALRGLFFQKNPDLSGVDKYVSRKGHWVDVNNWVSEKLIRIWEDALERSIYPYFTTDRILSCVEENPFYPFTRDHKLARQAMLERIPDRIADLYPMARSMRRHFILHIGPTNSGKTHDAVVACEAAPRGVYLAPLRLLAMEVAERMNGDGIPCNMITGEEEKRIPGAEHTASTIEMLSESEWYDVAIIDECQMIADSERGWAWTQAMLGVAASTVHACMAPEAEGLIIQLIEECGDTWEIVRHHRATPLEMEDASFVFPDDVRPGDALVVFSRRSVLQAASILEDTGRKVSVIYGALPYEARQAETRKFATGETRIVVATDAIGMGMNLPVKRIVFLENQKFDGVSKRELNASEVKQIAGRAGRRGYEEKGLVNASYDWRAVRYKLGAKVESILRARTAMPPFLAQMDQPLSGILQDWQSLPDQGIYQKTSMNRAIQLCIWLEENCPLDKETMLRGITIPFDEENPELLDFWKTAMTNVYEDNAILTGVDVVTALPGDHLDELEDKYRQLDLVYYLQRAFGSGELETDRIKQYILACKADVSAAIIERLKKAKKIYKRCRVCGKILPWNDPYALCEDCFQAQREGRYQ